MSDPLFPFLLAPAGFRHFFTKVIGIECDLLEQKHRSDIIAALVALISSHSQDRRPSTIQAPLKCHRWIKLVPAPAARAPAGSHHRQRSAALRAAAAKQHDQAVEPLCPGKELLDGNGHIDGEFSDVHYLAALR